MLNRSRIVLPSFYGQGETAKDMRPRDVNQLAKLIVDIATSEVEDTIFKQKKNPAAVALDRLGD